jgi:hypothetical protein
MPPKKASKTETKKKEKKLEDKTFGLKNKNKSKKVQQFIAQQTASSGLVKKAPEKKKEIDIEKDLFQAPTVIQKVPFGTDPKTVLCINFKNKNCNLGSKCKFSHDLQVERKVEKRSLYAEPPKPEKEETVEDWDQTQLENEITKKEGNHNKNRQTEIICKYFLEAIENHKYGWFWICPNGGDDCKYRHCLPPGFVLKSKERKEKKDEITIEELIEHKRKELGAGTMVTHETFMEWKKNRMELKKREQEEKDKKKVDNAKRLKIFSGLNGRELFEFNPEWVNQDDDEAGDMDVSVMSLEVSVGGMSVD